MSEEDRIAEARRAGFYPLLLLLERLQRDRARVGTGADPLEEGIRFRHDPALGFSSSDVAALERRTLAADPEDALSPSHETYQITTTFLGLTGPVSPLPAYFSEELVQEEADSTPTRDFLDMFHHRLLSLVYRAQARFDLPNERLSDGSDAWSRRSLALLGFDEAGLARSALPSWRLLRLAGLLGDGEVTAATLEVALADLLGPELGEGGVSVEQFVGSGVSVEQFVGTWAQVEPGHVTRLGRNASQLGLDLLLGRRVFDRAGKFRIVIGPLSREGYGRFAEGSEPLRRIAEVVSTLLEGALEFEVVLWLSREAAPSMRLSSSGRTRLGKNSWLGGQSREARVPVRVPSV